MPRQRFKKIIAKLRQVVRRHPAALQLYEVLPRKTRVDFKDVETGWDHPLSPFSPWASGQNFPPERLIHVLKGAIGPTTYFPDLEIHCVEEWNLKAATTALTRLGVTLNPEFSRKGTTTTQRRRSLPLWRLQNADSGGKEKPLVVIMPGIGPGVQATVPSRLAVTFAQLFDTMALNPYEAIRRIGPVPGASDVHIDPFDAEAKAKLIFDALKSGFAGEPGEREYDPKRVLLVTHSGGYEVLLALLKLVGEDDS